MNMKPAPRPPSPEEKAVFCVAQLADGTHSLIVQVPEAGWDYLGTGATITVDLKRLGIPVELVIGRVKDRAEAIKTIEQANTSRGMASLHMPQEDFSIKRGQG